MRCFAVKGTIILAVKLTAIYRPIILSAKFSCKMHPFYCRMYIVLQLNAVNFTVKY